MIARRGCAWMGVQTMSSHGDDGRRGLSRQGSVYSLTLTEVETQLGEPLRTMNLDDLLRTVLPAADPPAAKKTVDEVWRDIQSASGGARQPTMGEMTLEDFLSRAGVAVDAGCAGPHWLHQYPPPQQYVLPRPLPLGAAGDAVYRDGVGVGTFLSQVAGRKRGAAAAAVGGDGVVERTVERRQKRMIKNRESAARSRARKQAYTNELENKIAKLEEENKRLRKLKIPRKGKAAQTDKVQCYEPANMKYLGYFPALTPDEVKEHVAQARKAQKVWAKSSFKQRRQFLRILLKYILEHQDLICEVSSRDTGKTMVDASLGEIMTTCEKITWLLDEGEKWLKPEYRSTGRSMLHKRAKVEFYPLGVVGAIVSWNYPFHNVFNPMLAAVFSGNAAVIKVSEHATWSGCFYFRIIQAALSAVGAPENLVHIITGFAETGQALVSSVDKIIFVGSPGVGRMIMQRASETLIPVTLELGGKDSFIVCEDVDLPNVVQVAVRAALQSSGQNCAGAERFYVHNDIYSAFVSQVAKIVKSICVGPPLSGRYDMGAICMIEHSEKLQNLVNDALDKGAEIAVRGSFGNLGEDAVDQFFPPTVLVNVDHTMKIMQEEAFGPILPIMKFSSDEEAIKLANDSKYGLGCAVFSGNQKRAIRIASQLHCGVAAINDFASSYMCQSLPFGGVKDSGFGRFAGVEGLRACCLVKAVVEDRFWPYIKTMIPKPIQYPISEHGFEFQQLLVETLYGYSVWDRLRSLVNLVKMITEQNSTPAPSTRIKKRR